MSSLAKMSGAISRPAGRGVPYLMRWAVAVCTLLLFIQLAASPALHAQNDEDGSATTSNGVELKVRIENVDTVTLLKSADGYRYRVTWNDEKVETFTPAEYAQLVYEDQSGRPWYQLFLNISSPFGMTWVALGLLGQILFTGRMVVQWLTSEKERRSVVPVAFWWMSLTGATMLMVYFVWRKDAVAVLGQATGWFIYVRNLWLIYAARKTAED